MEPYDVIVNQPVVIDNVSGYKVCLQKCRIIFYTAWIIRPKQKSIDIC